MYGKNNESSFVHSSMETANLISMKKISLKISLEWERECKVQFLTQVLPKQGHAYSLLTKERLVNFA